MSIDIIQSQGVMVLCLRQLADKVESGELVCVDTDQREGWGMRGNPNERTLTVTFVMREPSP